MSSSRGAARAAVFFGALGVLALPVGAAAAQVLNGIGLLQSLYVSVPVAGGCGLIAVLASRRARLAATRSVFQQRRGLLRAGRWLAWLALYVAVVGALALGVYAVLRARH